MGQVTRNVGLVSRRVCNVALLHLRSAMAGTMQLLFVVIAQKRCKAELVTIFGVMLKKMLANHLMFFVIGFLILVALLVINVVFLVQRVVPPYAKI